MGTNLPAAKKIVGTAETRDGSKAFAFDTVTRTLTLGFDRPDREPSKPTREQLVELERELQKELGVGLSATRVGEYHCYDCGKWFDVMREPTRWSLGMCFSCSMDRSSDIADHFD